MEKITIMDVMLYCDGALGAADMARVASAIARDPELQAMERDLREGSAAAKATFAAIGDAPIPLRLAKAIQQRRGVARLFDRVDSQVLRYAAAALIGVLVGGGGMLAGLRVQEPDYLHLASAPNGQMGTGLTDLGESEEFHAALGVALRGSELGKASSYRSGDIDGSVEVTKRFATSNGAACAEFSHQLTGPTTHETRQGIACERKDGGWEVIQLPAGG
jgi:surface antigen